MGQLAIAIHTAAQRIPAAPVAAPADLLTGPQLAAIFAQVEAAVAALELRAAGSEILSNTGPPSNSAGNDHDLYVNAANGDLWGKEAGAWSFLINLRGPAGLAGPRGATGEQGDTGLRGRDGAAGRNGTNGTDGSDGTDGRDGTRIRVYAASPAPSDGNLDDVAIVSTTGDLLEKTASGWAVRGNLKGPKGDAGTGGSGAGTAYTLPQATAGLLGGLKLGTGLTYNPTTDRVDAAGGSASFPAQSNATQGHYLKSTGVAGAEEWVGLKVGYVLRFLNAETQDPQRFFRATTLYRIQKDAGVATVSYAVNGAAAVTLAFVADVFTGNILFPANSLVVWSITYQSGLNEGNVELLGNELTTP